MCLLRKVIIISLKVFNSVTGWTLEKTDFLNLTLLVGGSGVGKTKIEESIKVLKAIAEGSAEEDEINGFNWTLEFTIDSEKKIFILGKDLSKKRTSTPYTPITETLKIYLKMPMELTMKKEARSRQNP